MRVIICADAATATARVVKMIADQVADQPASVLGLATGGTMDNVYAGLIARHAQGLSFARVTTFNLDEYVGLSPDHPQSYAAYMRHRFFDHIDIRQDAYFLPAGLGLTAANAAAYEDILTARGPIDLQLLGLGKNGHIGFNEPGSSLTSRTREKALTRETRAANRRFFDDHEAVPHSSVTMGVGTICDARRIVLLAVGEAKTSAVTALVEGPVSAFCPGSILQMHKAVTVIVDEAAAAGLSLQDHYKYAEEVQALREGDQG